MGKVIDYYFSPISPWTYLGHERLGQIAARRGAEVHCKPADFAKIFAVSGGLPLGKRAPQRQAYRLVELERWRRRNGLPLTIQPRFFPAPADLAARAIISAPQAKQFHFAGALLRAIWAEEQDIADPSTVSKIAEICDIQGRELLAVAQTTEIGGRYESFTQEAIARQVFGAPTYIFRNEPFWGQDRLDFLEHALAEE